MDQISDACKKSVAKLRTENPVTLLQAYITTKVNYMAMWWHALWPVEKE
jgi:hypothetical protein